MVPNCLQALIADGVRQSWSRLCVGGRYRTVACRADWHMHISESCWTLECPPTKAGFRWCCAIRGSLAVPFDDWHFLCIAFVCPLVANHNPKKESTMQPVKRILVPIDLSRESQPAISLATTLAKANGADLILCHVSMSPLTADLMYAHSEFQEVMERERKAFEQVIPDDSSVRFSHKFLNGNPGPEIVRIADEAACDMIVIGTHGRTGIVRLVLGSVAEYVIRNSNVPVVTVKIPRQEVEKTEVTEDTLIGVNSQSPFVTYAMNHAPPVHEFDEMPEVISELKAARSSAAPVIDEMGKCIGILTDTDIQNYFDLCRRFDERDESVLDEVYETDEFGMRRTDLKPFHQVKRHMTSPVVTISNDVRYVGAEEIFESNPGIHHLVVVDEKGKPLGIVRPEQVLPSQTWDLDLESIPA